MTAISRSNLSCKRIKYARVVELLVIEEIKAAIANCGYDADDVQADEDAYKRLPKTCKKFEDGGGHPKPKVPTRPVLSQ